MWKLIFLPAFALSVLASCESVDDDAAGSLPLQTKGSPEIEVGRISAEGTGCPAGTWEKHILADSTGLLNVKITFFAFQVSTSEGTTPVLKSSCTVTIPVKSTPDLQYALSEIVFHGAASLKQNVIGTVETNAAFAGAAMLNDTRQVRTFTGPWDTPEMPRGIIRIGHNPRVITWAPCGASREFKVFVELKLQVPPAQLDSSNYLKLYEQVAVVGGTSVNQGDAAVQVVFDTNSCPRL